MHMVTNNTIQPLDPKHLVRAKAFEIPNIIILITNKLIDENWDGHQSKVWQSELITRIQQMTGIDRADILRNNWLNLETTYRRVGYDVNYVAPVWGEKGDAYFEFIPQIS